MIQERNEGAKRINEADEWIMQQERTVTKGIYKKTEYQHEIYGKQIHTEKIGEESTTYSYAINKANDRLKLNGKVYNCRSEYGWAIRIMKTFISSTNGAVGVLDMLVNFQPACVDGYERKIIENTKPLKK